MSDPTSSAFDWARFERLSALKQDWNDCQRCGLGATRRCLAFADGAPDAKVMIIGGGPGEQEDRSGIPFSGLAGHLLQRLFDYANVDARTEVHLTNLVMCRPVDGDSNRDPISVEIAACRPRLMAQVRLVDPDLIIAVGRVAAQALTQNKKIAITRDRGTIVECTLEGEMAPYTVPVLLKIDPAAETAIADLITSRAKIQEFQREHAHVFTDWEQLVDTYNKAALIAKAACKEAAGERSMDFGGGVSTRVSVSKYYDPAVLEKVAPGIFAEPGVVTAVSADRINELVEQGELPKEIAQRALTEKKTISVYGAKPVEMKC